jgi:ABC-type transport system substrate-binding protein
MPGKEFSRAGPFLEKARCLWKVGVSNEVRLWRDDEVNRMKNGMKKSVFAVLVSVLVFGLCSIGWAKDTLVVADQYDATTMDPIRHNDMPSARACHSIYDTLVFLNSDGTVRPGLAESWEFPSDTAYKMHLRKDVVFHNGEKMTAKDVKYSLERPPRISERPSRPTPRTSTTWRSWTTTR